MMTGDDDIVRTIVELPDIQIKALASFCRREGISRAEAIRRAVDQLMAGNTRDQSQQNRSAAFGLWKGRHTDGRGYVETLRGEWEEQR